MGVIFTPDGIRAFYAVFQKWPFWQTGHFTGFSRGQTPRLPAAWIPETGGSGDYPGMTGQQDLGKTGIFVKR
jgi:hypothetical protein